MVGVLDGKPHTGAQYLSGANDSVRWFPFDQHLRNMRAMIARRVAELPTE